MRLFQAARELKMKLAEAAHALELSERWSEAEMIQNE